MHPWGQVVAGAGRQGCRGAIRGISHWQGRTCVMMVPRHLPPCDQTQCALPLVDITHPKHSPICLQEIIAECGDKVLLATGS